MGFVADAIGGIADGIGDAVGGAVDFVSDNPWVLAAAVPFAAPAALGALGSFGTSAALGSGFTGLGTVGFNSALGGGLGAGLLEGIGGGALAGGLGGGLAGGGLLGSGLAIGSGLLDIGGAAGGGGFLSSLGSVGSTINGISSFLKPALGIASQFQSANNSGRAAEQASAFQQQAAIAQMAEANKRYSDIQQGLDPYKAWGPYATNLRAQMLGQAGPGAQQAQYDEILNGPLGSTLLKQGENALLQNAAATGGLRGGNAQDALAKHREQMANQLITQRFDQLGQMANLGQNSVLGLGGAGQTAGAQVINALGQQGAAQAGNALAQGKVDNSLLNNLANAGGLLGSLFG